jgi:hypothetical protein
MDHNDREAIERLFTRIEEVERRSGPRDAQAEALIRRKIADDPAAAYYMAQTIVVQEQALAEAERRLSELEQQPARQPGLFEGLFGQGRQDQRGRRPEPANDEPRGGPWGSRGASGRGMGMGGGMGGGGFLAGAAQTAMGVAGGVLLGNMIGGLFSADPAAADTGTDAGAGDTADPGTDQAADAGDSGDVGGDFDMGDF